MYSHLFELAYAIRLLYCDAYRDAGGHCTPQNGAYLNFKDDRQKLYFR